MVKAINFMLPYIIDKSKWPLPPDIMYWAQWPVAHPSMLFAYKRLGNKEEHYKAWREHEHFPTNAEVVRNMPVRHPAIWM